MLVVVPTAQSGRRLREALAERADEEGSGLLSPQVVTPSWFFQSDSAAPPLAVKAAWAEVLRSAPDESLRPLFPRLPEERSLSWELSLGQEFAKVVDELAEANLSWEAVRSRTPERGRWIALERLASEVFHLLGRWGLEPPARAKERAIETIELPRGFRQVVLAGVPDPSPLARRAWRRLADEGTRMEVLIHASQEVAEGFDDWGGPRQEFWKERILPFPKWEERWEVLRDAEEASRAAVRAFAEVPSWKAAVGMCDSRLTPAIERAFQESGWSPFRPEGSRAPLEGFLRWLDALRELAGPEPSLSAVETWLRWPADEKAFQLLGAFYREKERTVAMSLVDLRRGAKGPLREALQAVTRLHEELRRRGGEEKVWSLLEEVLSGLSEEAAQVVAGACESWQDWRRRTEWSFGDCLTLLAKELGSQRVFQEEERGVMDLQGWLELSYEQADHLLLVGLHEGAVPERIQDDPFLPNQLREDLGLRSRQGRQARDAFLWESLVRARPAGWVRVLTTKFPLSGDPCPPSRLLLQTKGEELAARVRKGFGEVASPGKSAVVWQRDWNLQLPEGGLAFPAQKALSPSLLRDYLRCPFRFYLKHALGMERTDPEKREMNALDFGSLAHRVLEQFGRGESRGSSDAEEIAEFLSQELDQELARFFGPEPSLAVAVQAESLRERLRKFAEEQAVHRAEGWRVVETEYQFRGETALELGGRRFHLTIDRVDERDGEFQIWDYKTSGKRTSPGEQHLQAWPENRDALGPLVPKKGRQKQDRGWVDLQLPLYAWAAAQTWTGGRVPQVGYIHLPRAMSEVGFESWEEEEALQSEALAWAEEAVRRIDAGQFLPETEWTGEEAKFDEFASLAAGGTSLSEAFGREGGAGVA